LFTIEFVLSIFLLEFCSFPSYASYFVRIYSLC